MIISKENIKYSLNNIKKSRARSVLTILSIFFGIATIFIFVSFGWGLYDYIDEFTASSSADKLMIMSKGAGGIPGLDSTFKLLDDDIDAIKNTPGIYEVTGIYLGAGEVIQDNLKKYVFVTSYDPDLPLIMELSDIEIVEGRALRSNDLGKVTLGYNYLLKNKIFPKAYSLNSKIDVQGQELRIVGFYESVGNPQDDSNIYVTNDFMTELYPDKNLSYGMIIARADKNNVDGVADNVEKKLRQHRNLDEGKEDFTVQSYADLLESFTIVLDIIIGFIILIALISVIVSAVNTANTMITSVLERFKEIGILKLELETLKFLKYFYLNLVFSDLSLGQLV